MRGYEAMALVLLMVQGAVLALAGAAVIVGLLLLTGALVLP